jgi:hypothetical protein
MNALIGDQTVISKMRGKVDRKKIWTLQNIRTHNFSSSILNETTGSKEDGLDRFKNDKR